MTNKERLLTAAAFREADRVPIELRISAQAKELPECKNIVNFIDEEADNFLGMGVDWGFMGLDSKYHEEIEIDLPGEYRVLRRIHSTEAGDFIALTKHQYPHLDNPDFYWIKHYIATIDDLDRLINASRVNLPIMPVTYCEKVKKIGARGVPIVGMWHPLGALVRNATLEEVYGWLASEAKMIHKFLETTNAQIVKALRAVSATDMNPWFITYAYEMLIPPWLGRKHFDEYVFSYDKMVNDEIHRIGGRVRAHCHGNVMHFLKHMSDMGIDSIEPLEPPPYGNVNLAEAKRLVGDRMVLSGNIPSQAFPIMSRDQVTESVKDAIAAAASGGGFTLRTTGSHSGINPYLEPAILKKVIENVEAYIDAGLKYGQYR